jgi:hypothetical protein
MRTTSNDGSDETATTYATVSIGMSGDSPEVDGSLWLEADESVVAQVSGLGASLYLTTQRLVLVREGAEFRPRSGVRSWPHDALRAVLLSPTKHGQARIAVKAGPRAEDVVSMFFAEEDGRDAALMIREIRRLLRLGGSRR